MSGWADGIMGKKEIGSRKMGEGNRGKFKFQFPNYSRKI